MLLLLSGRLALAQETPAPADRPSAHRVEVVEGWTVQVDERLLAQPNKILGEQARVLLRAKLADIEAVLPAEVLVKLRQVPIWLDLNHGSLKSMQYHPSAEWLTKNGFEAALTKVVHIPSAERFTNPAHREVQPWCVMHELAHAYHDQVLGFNNPRVIEVWQHYKESHHGESVLHVKGQRVRHYALTNEKEFFAEMTEAYLGTNDFFPFVYGELKEAEPETEALLREVWGAPPMTARR
jgi:hypothetical protein